MEHLYTVHSKDIVLNSIADEITLYCFGDLHRFTPSCDEDRWKWFLSCAKKEMTPFTYFLGLGDYMDMASGKEQKVFNRGDLHEQTVQDLGELIQKRNRVLAVEMSFMKPNILGLIEGNHGWRFANGKTGTDDLAERLITESLGFLCHYTLKVSFANRNADATRANIHIVACHGRAGGKTEGASINQVDDLRRIFPVADIYVFGHDHQRWAKPTDVLIPTNDNKGRVFIKQKRQFLSRAGSFKKAYTPGTSGYEIGRLLKPADLGVLQYKIRMHRDLKDGDRVTVDIKAII